MQRRVAVLRSSPLECSRCPGTRSFCPRTVDRGYGDSAGTGQRRVPHYPRVVVIGWAHCGVTSTPAETTLSWHGGPDGRADHLRFVGIMEDPENVEMPSVARLPPGHPRPQCSRPCLPYPLPFPSLVTTSVPFGDPQDCQVRPVSEEGVTAHPIVVSDSSLDDGPGFLGGSGVEDRRSVLHPGSTEGALHPGVAPGLRRAQESRAPAACVPPAPAALEPAGVREPASKPGGTLPFLPALPPETPSPDAVAGIRSPHSPGGRLIVCLNPRLSEERRRRREQLLATTGETLERIAASVPLNREGGDRAPGRP